MYIYVCMNVCVCKILIHINFSAIYIVTLTIVMRPLSNFSVVWRFAEHSLYGATSGRAFNMAAGAQLVHRRDGTDRFVRDIGERMLLFISWWTDLWRWDTLISSARSTKIVISLQLRAARLSGWATYQQVRSSTSSTAPTGSKSYS